jgi:hypothetical protein
MKLLVQEAAGSPSVHGIIVYLSAQWMSPSLIGIKACLYWAILLNGDKMTILFKNSCEDFVFCPLANSILPSR